MGPLAVYRLEVYGVLIALILATNFGCYVYGRSSEREEIHSKQLEADATAVHSILEDERRRTDDDALARKTTEDFLAHVNQGLSDVSAKYSKLPNVVVDSRGCERLADAFGVRWNAAAGVSTEPADGSTDGSAGAVLRQDVHPTQ